MVDISHADVVVRVGCDRGPDCPPLGSQWLAGWPLSMHGRSAQGGRCLWSFHAVVPQTTTRRALDGAQTVGFAAAAGRRLHPHSSTRSVRPLGRLGRLLQQPPSHSPHWLLAHLLTQAHQLLPLAGGALAGIAVPPLLLTLARVRARRRLARSMTALAIRPGRETVQPAALERSLAALHGLLPAWHRRLLGETPWLLLELERDPERGLQLRLLTQRAVLPLASSVADRPLRLTREIPTGRGEVTQQRSAGSRRSQVGVAGPATPLEADRALTRRALAALPSNFVRSLVCFQPGHEGAARLAPRASSLQIRQQQHSDFPLVSTTRQVL
jgi:hypothetical protein